jgi:hypothetical protein
MLVVVVIIIAFLIHIDIKVVRDVHVIHVKLTTLPFVIRVTSASLS